MVGADHFKTRFVAVTVTFVMDGSGATKMVNLLLAVKGGELLSVTRVMNCAASPGGETFVQVMMPLLMLVPAGAFMRL